MCEWVQGEQAATEDRGTVMDYEVVRVEMKKGE